MNIRDKVRQAAREQELMRAVKWRNECEQREREHLENVNKSMSWRNTLSWASPASYKEWLNWFIENGGEITHVYNYKMPDTFFIATVDTVITPLYGSSSISVIVPKGIEVIGEAGHNNIYRYDTKSRRPTFVPLYLDT